jgi:hypothetical protein
MGSFLGQSIFGLFISLFSAHIQVALDLNTDVNGYVSFVGSQYIAEASIAKQLYAVKSEDIDRISKVSGKYGVTTENASYGTLNEWAETGYFDVAFRNSPQDRVDIGRVSGVDIAAREVKSEDFFNQAALDYNKTDAEHIEFTIYKVTKWQDTRCSYSDYEESTCPGMDKTVISTLDNSLNGASKDGYTIRFQFGEDGFVNRLFIEGFDPNSKNYRITSNTVSWKATDMQYSVYYNGTKKDLTNNIVEIDTIGNAIDNFARLKLQKGLNDEISPLGKYVLFSNTQVLK